MSLDRSHCEIMHLVGTFFLILFQNFVNSSPVFGYHNEVGIPKAKLLMDLEDLGKSNVARIVGGSQVSSPSVYPFYAGIICTLTNRATSICGGSLISNTRLLTAAHCWWDGQNRAQEFTIVLGSTKLFSGGTRIATRDVVSHPSWNTRDITNDIAVVKITSIQYTNNIRAIPLPSAANANQDFSGLVGIAVGYGKTRDAQNGFPTSTALHHVNVNIITNAVCSRSFNIALHGSHLCTSGTGGVGTCDGDSGGPLTAMVNDQRTLVGIVSFGLADGCQSGLPSVYTRVTSFLTWIQANS